MASSSRTKTADRQAILKKLLPVLKKQYKVTVPKLDRPVMETMLYAVCLENSTVEQSDAAYARFSQMFPDLNEARVSSISEIEPAFSGLDGTDWRAFRARAILQYVFDKTYNFEFESLRKKTLELAEKQLSKIKHLSPFVRKFTLQQVIGAHVLPVDDATARFLIWMGLATADQPLDDIGEGLKSAVRKAESHQFSFSIRCIAADPQLKTAFDPKVYLPPAEGHDIGTAMDRLAALFKHGLSSVKSAPPPVADASKKSGKLKAPVVKETAKPAKSPAAKVEPSPKSAPPVEPAVAAAKPTAAKPAAKAAAKPAAESVPKESATKKAPAKKSAKSASSKAPPAKTKAAPKKSKA